MTHYPIIDGGVTPVQFKTLFTVQERAAIRALRKGDATATPPVEPDTILNEFMDIVDDPRCTTILLNTQSMVNGLQYLVDKSIINESRIADILEAKII